MLALVDPRSESWSGDDYVPRDEAFSEVKQATFTINVVRQVIHALLPSLDTAVIDPKLGFPFFDSIDALYNEGMRFPKEKGLAFFRTLLPRLVKTIAEDTDQVLLFETPEMIDSKFFLLPWHCMTKTRNYISCNVHALLRIPTHVSHILTSNINSRNQMMRELRTYDKL